MTTNLLDFMDACTARDEAMASVEAHAEEASPGFADRAAAFVLDMLAEQGPLSGEALTDACIAAGIVPHNSKAFGPVMMRLSRRKLIEKAGSVPRRKGHNSGAAWIWKLTST